MPGSIVQQKKSISQTISQEHSDESSCSKEAYPLSFSELLTYINETKDNRESASPVMFRLADHTQIYMERLEQLGVESPNVHSNRLKDKLMAQKSELESHKKGRDVLLAFKEDIGPVSSQASDNSDTIIISKAASILHNQIINHRSEILMNSAWMFPFHLLLLQFVCMIEHGVDIKSQLRFGASKTVLAMAQLLPSFNI